MPTVVDHPLVLHKLTILRARQTDTPTFRRTLREIGWLLGAAATRDLPLATRRIDTPLTTMDAPVLAEPPPAVISILRAGNGLLDGILDLIPDAAVGHVGLQRDHATLEAVRYYEKFPDRMGERTVLVVDPMLATGNSAAAAVDRARAAGARRLRLVCLLAAPEGLAAFAARHPDVSVVTGAVDERLNENGYILPGLGDAGDRMYGTA